MLAGFSNIRIMETSGYCSNKIGGDLIGSNAMKQSIGNIENSIVIGANCANVTVNIVIGSPGNTTAIIGDNNSDAGNITITSEQLVKLLSDIMKNLILADKAERRAK